MLLAALPLLPSLALYQDNLVEEVWWRLRAWEAIFERAQIVYERPDALKSGRMTLILSHWPGVSVLRRSAHGDGSRDALHSPGLETVVFGKYTRWTPGEPERHAYETFGTEMAEEYTAAVGGLQEILYIAGARVTAETRWSDWWRLSQNKRKVREHLGDLVVSLTVSVAGIDVPAKILLKRDRLCPAEIVMRPGQAKEVAWRISPACFSDGAADPFGVSYLIETRFGGGDREYESVIIRNVRPYDGQPTVPVVSRDTAVVSEPLGIERRAGAPPPFDEEEGSLVLRRAREQSLAPGEWNTAGITNRCGPEALWYLSRLVGRSVSFREIEGKFSNADEGTSMLQLLRVGRGIGLSLEPMRNEAAILTAEDLPAILAVRPSHFVVCVSRDQGGFTLICPPNRVVRLDQDQLSRVWTGYALRAGTDE